VFSDMADNDGFVLLYVHPEVDIREGFLSGKIRSNDTINIIVSRLINQGVLTNSWKFCTFLLGKYLKERDIDGNLRSS
jgi:hypothetical protein